MRRPFVLAAFVGAAVLLAVAWIFRGEDDTARAPDAAPASDEAPSPSGRPAPRKRIAARRDLGADAEAQAPGEEEAGDGREHPEHAELLRGIRAAATSTSGPERQRWYLVSVARLLSHPGECAELAEMFKSGELDPAGRAVILDLLANAGHADAQAALRSIFEDGSVASDPQFGELVRRLGGVEHPEQDTADLVARMYGAGTGDRRALAETLGTVTGKLEEDGWVDLAARHSARLTQDLERARTPEERAALLEALGRTNMPANLPPVLRYAHDPSAELRGAAARALRHVDDPAATKALEELASDADPEVKKAALAALASRGHRP